MADPTTTNQPATQIDSAIAQAVSAGEQIADTAIETSLDAAIPFFAVPVIKQVTDAVIEEIVKLIGDKASISIQTVGTFVVIDTQVSGEEGGISQALANLMLAEKSGNPQQIQEAILGYQQAQSNLVNSNGSARPQS